MWIFGVQSMPWKKIKLNENVCLFLKKGPIRASWAINMHTTCYRKSKNLPFTVNQFFVYFGQLWKKKCFIVMHNSIIVLIKRKKTSELVCLFFVSFILETWKKKQIWERQSKKCFIFTTISVFRFVFGHKQTLC